jgi:AbiTii
MEQKEHRKVRSVQDTQSKTQYIISLAKELIDDIELSQIPVEALLLKTLRLARLSGSQETQTWIAYEAHV